jgi:hypothetical protein
MSVVAPGYNDSVFINCPFDSEYMSILQAVVYTIYRCGFYPQIALREDDATDFRLDKIMRLIQNCRYGVHDISRTEITHEGLPRFNMPFELGLFFGAKRFGNKAQRTKSALVLERIKFTYQRYISDLNGIDTKAHNNDPTIVIRQVRDWLATASARSGIPGHIIIQREYKQFRLDLIDIITEAGFDNDDILFSDFCKIVENALSCKLGNIVSH